MKECKTIMACVDMSTYSPMTLGYAFNLAGENNRLLICSVVHQRDVQPIYVAEMVSPFQFDTAEQLERLVAGRREMVETFIAERFPGRQAEVCIETGHPADKILSLVEAHRPDLVIMANKGRSNFSRFMFGSAAEHVFRECPVPLLSVRDKTIFRRSLPLNTDAAAAPIKTILAAVDLSPWSSEILSQAGWLAGETGARIEVFSCISRDEVDWVRRHYQPVQSFSDATYIEGERQRRLSRFSELLEATGLDDGGRIGVTVDSGFPFEMILKAVNRLKADMLVLGPRGRGRTGRFRFGRTAEKLFRHCPVPVLRLGPEIKP